MVSDGVSNYLVGKIPEISYFLSSILMVFGSDYLMGRVLLRRLKKSNFLSRTVMFVLYSLLALPALTAAGAYLLREMILAPFKEQIALVMAVFFLFTGVLLSARYNMKMGLKAR